MINKIILLVAFTLVSALSFSQDVIVKKTGATIEVKIIEITPTLIKYKKFSQLDGPLRNIEIVNVREIQYEDGEIESFENHSTQLEEVVIEQSEPEPAVEIILEEPKDLLFSSGFSMHLLLGYGQNTRYYEDYYYYDPYNNPGYTTSPIQENVTEYITINLVIGNKWYFGNSEKWRPGIQLNWARFGINIDPKNPFRVIIDPKNISPVNVGMCNIFKFSENMGLEFNFTTGLNLELDLDYGRVTPGLAITPELKFRYNNLAVGLDYSRIQTFESNTLRQSNWNIVGVTVGLKL